MIKKKYIGKGLDGVGSREFQLENDLSLKATTAAGVAEPLLKLDTANVLQLLKLPRVETDAIHGNDLVRKSQLDTKVADAEARLNLEIDLVENRLIAEEARALAAEGLLGGRIEAEKTRAMNAEYALHLEVEAEKTRAMAAEGATSSEVATKLSASAVGVSVAPLVSGFIPAQYIPAIALTSVTVVNTIAERDLLTVQSGDVVKVIQGILASDGVTYLPRTFIHNGTTFIDIASESDVDSIQGKVGHVSLTTADIPSFGNNRYFTPALEQGVKDYASGLVSAEATARAAADQSIRTDYAAADAAIISGYQAAVAAEAATRLAQDTAIRGEFAAADTAIIAGYQAADTLIRSDFASADAAIRSEFQSADTVLRSEMAAYDAANLVTAKAYTDSEIISKVTSKYGVASGIATLDSSGRLPVSYLPGIALTDVYSVTTLAERDALNSSVQEGDICRVAQAEIAQDGGFLMRTYVRMKDNLTQVESWLEVVSESDVFSVAGKRGTVTLDTGDVSEKIGGPFYFTDGRAQTASVVNSILGDEIIKAPSVRAAKAYSDGILVSAKGYTDSELDKLKTQELVYESVTVDAAIVASNQITLSAIPKAMPLIMRQHILGRPGIDFTISGAVVTFIGEWAAPSGESKLEISDVISFYFMKEGSPFLN